MPLLSSCSESTRGRRPSLKHNLQSPRLSQLPLLPPPLQPPSPPQPPPKTLRRSLVTFSPLRKSEQVEGQGRRRSWGQGQKDFNCRSYPTTPGGSTCRERARKGKGKRKGEGTREGERKGEGQRETGWGKHSQGSHNHGHHHHPHHHRFNNNCTSYWGQNVTQSSFTCPHTCTDPTCIHSHTSCLLSEQNRRGPSTVPCCTSHSHQNPQPSPSCVTLRAGEESDPGEEPHPRWRAEA